jgi:YD repeat-containing protein
MKHLALAALLLPASLLAEAAPPLLEFASGLPGKQVRLTWPAAKGVRYRIERSAELTATTWRQVALVEADGTDGEWLDPEATATKAFYRILQPQPEVFSISLPVLSPAGGDLRIFGQLLPTGSVLVIEIEGQAPLIVPLSAMADGEWRAMVSGLFAPGSHIIAARIEDANGVTLVTLNQPLAVTETGRAADSPPSLPPATPSPLDSSNPIPGVGIVVKRNGPSARVRKAETDSYSPWDSDADSGVVSNPLHEDKGNSGTNPLYQGRVMKGENPLFEAPGLEVASALYQGSNNARHAITTKGGATSGRVAAPSLDHAINTKGTGTSGRIMPAASGLPGEVSFQVCDLSVPCPAGPPLEWVRTYRSMKPVSSGFGDGWDCSYNIRVETQPALAGAAASRVVIHDGGGRADVFHRQPDGTFRCDGMFREGRFQGDAFILTFADKGTWTFHPFDGTPRAGKISSITDRNGVSLACTHDPAGQLIQVADAFGHRLDVEWGSAPNRILSVTFASASFSYAKVTYTYTAAGERLQSSSAPFEPGRPPVAGDTTYAYITGSPDPRWNDNLLSVTDGAGRLLEAFTYSSATDPLDISYDTCASHDRNRRLSAGQLRFNTHEALSSGDYLVIDNDELGRVTERAFNKMHRLLRCREYTGFAIPGQPVTSTTNRPAGKLRSGDPDYFETSCAYNADGLCTRIIYPDGSQEQVAYDRDFRKDCPVRERGNARSVTLVSNTGERRTVSSEYLPGFGSSESARPGNPIGGLTIKGGRNPGGNIADLSARASDSINGGMPNRISMNVTVPKQTQGATFGEKVNQGLQSAGSALATGRKAKAWMVNNFEVHRVNAHGQTTTWTFDPAGNCTGAFSPVPGKGTLFDYNALGQCTACTVLDGPGSSFRDEITYDPASSHFLSVIHDKSSNGDGLKLTTTYERDPQGRVNRIVDPRGHDWTFGYNALGQCIAAGSPEMPNRISMNLSIDAGGRIVRCDTEHRGPDGSPDPINPVYSTFYIWDSRSQLARVASEERPVDASGVLDPASLGIENFAVCDITYDDAGQCVSLSTPAACRAQVQDLACDFSYDERGLPYRCVDGGSGSPDAVTTGFDYDAFGALTRHVVLGSGASSETLFTYDGFHRTTSITDAMGNVTSFGYANDGSVMCSVYGELLDVPGSLGNILLSRSTMNLSAAGKHAINTKGTGTSGRLMAHEAAHVVQQRGGVTLRTMNPFLEVEREDDLCTIERFTPGQPGAPARETTVVDRSPSGLPLSVITNGDLQQTCTYDSAGRLATCSDGTCTSTYTRDGNGNTTLCGTTTHFLNAGTPDETFSLASEYDALNRCTEVTDGSGNVVSQQFDSLSRCVSRTDASSRTTFHAYDGGTPAAPFSMRVSADADGDGLAEVMASSFTRCGELVSTTDSRGYATSFQRDASGRLTRCTYPDGSFEGFGYDSLGATVTMQSPNGSVCTMTCDALLRATKQEWTNEPSPVIPSPDRFFGYDGLGRRVSAEQGSSLVSFSFDSCGNPIGETSNGLSIARTFSHRGRTGITYPDGQQFSETRNALGQLLSISSVDAGGSPVLPPVVQFKYAGARVLSITQANGVTTSFDYRADGEAALPGAPDASFDACVRCTVTDGSGLLLSQTTTRRNPDQSVSREDTVFSPAPQQPPGRSKIFSYDHLGRMNGCETRRREVAGAASLVESDVTYTLDLEGRRLTATGGTNPGSYTQDDSLPPGDLQMHQYTTWPGGAVAWDDNGNLSSLQKSGATCQLSCDSGYQLVSVTDTSSGTGLVGYEYDAVGRRVGRNPQTGKGMRFVYDGDTCIQELEEDGSGSFTTSKSFVARGGVPYAMLGGGGALYPVSAAAAGGPRICTCPPGYSISGRGAGHSGTGNKVEHWGDPHENLSGKNKVEHWGDPHENLNGKNKVEHWGDPHENLNGKHIKDCEGLMTDDSGHVMERFDCDDAGGPLFLTAEGLPSSASSSASGLRWIAPEVMWEPSIRMLLNGGSVYSPELGCQVSSEKIKFKQEFGPTQATKKN